MSATMRFAVGVILRTGDLRAVDHQLSGHQPEDADLWAVRAFFVVNRFS
jgi:hypothetical protein